MKRLHVGLQVEDLEASVRFYGTLFGAEPTVLKDDYAKWMLDDPRVNFSISTRADNDTHMGIQVDNEAELTEVVDRLKQARLGVRETPGVTCCYARSDKAWSVDPQGLLWETFLTRGAATVYGEETLTEDDVETLRSPGCCD